MNDLINEIRTAKVRTAEEVVVDHLRRTGLVDKEPMPKNSKVICLQQQLAASQERVRALEDLVKSILLDLRQRAQLTDDPDLIDLSNGLIVRAAALLEKKCITT